jgi:uncharacterized protein YhfF
MQATAWILDVGHRARRLVCDVPPGARPLASVHDQAERELGITLGGPLAGRGPDLMFLHPRRGEGPAWEPLATWALDDAAFGRYVEAMLGGWTPPTRAPDVFAFGNTPELAAQLAHLVVKGEKRGTTCWIAAAERDGSKLPHLGLVSIVTDGFGYPVCAIQTAQVDHVRFRDIDATQAALEGEGDRSLDDWREVHLRYFHQEARQLGLTFTEDEIVCFEHFHVLAVLGRADTGATVAACGPGSPS